MMKTVSSSIVILLLCSACQTTLDKRQAALIQTWGAANQAFAQAIDVYRGKMNEVVTGYFSERRRLLNAEFELWLTRQTENGDLVRTDESDAVIRDAAGKTSPMKRADLTAALESRDSQLALIAEDEGRWNAYDMALRQAIEDFKNLNTVNLKDNEDVARARESAQQFLESSLAALAGMASGLAVGVAVAP